jgi:hypothetical protein
VGEREGLPFDFGFEGDGVPLSQAEVALLFAAEGDEKTLGRASGPAALADASQYVEFFEMQGAIHALDIGVYAELTGDSDSETLAIEQFKTAAARGIFPFIIAKHRFSLPNVTGPTVALWGKIGRAECEDTVLAPERNTLLIGVRAATEQAYHAIGDKVTMVTAADLRSRRPEIGQMIASLPSPVHLSIDYDVFDPNVAAIDRSPEPGGLTWYDFVDILERLFKGPGVKSADVVGAVNVEAKSRSALFGAQMVTKIIAFLQVNKSK